MIVNFDELVSPILISKTSKAVNSGQIAEVTTKVECKNVTFETAKNAFDIQRCLAIVSVIEESSKEISVSYPSATITYDATNNQFRITYDNIDCIWREDAIGPRVIVTSDATLSNPYAIYNKPYHSSVVGEPISTVFMKSELAFGDDIDITEEAYDFFTNTINIDRVTGPITISR